MDTKHANFFKSPNPASFGEIPVDGYFIALTCYNRAKKAGRLFIAPWTGDFPKRSRAL